MAVINLPRIGPVGDAVRDFPVPRRLPLYLGAAIAGGAIGLGLAGFGSGSESTDAPAANLSAPVTAATDPAVDTRPIELILAELPEMQPNGVYAIPAAPAAEGEAPVAEAATAPEAAPAASQPAASQPASSQPVTQPAPPAPAPPAPPAPAEPAMPSNFYLPSVGAVGGMSGLESQMFQLMNAERAAAGLPGYQWDATLSRISRIRGQQMIDQGYFAHTDPYGYTMYAELLSHFGVGFRVAGENLVVNGYGYDVSASLAVEGLMNSPTHRANMLDPNFSRVGVGEVTAPNGAHYYTLVFVS